MIHWEGKDPATVERAIKMLLRTLHSVESIDGSGGDAGQDVRYVDPNGHLTIFEVKSFTDQLKPARRNQIAKSLKNAAAHKPKRWVLVIPKDQTPSERDWFTNELPTLAPGVSLEWRGRDWLDGQFAQHEDLVAMVEGHDYQLLKRAQELNFEQAILSGGIDDFLDRVRRLDEQLDDISPWWRFDTAQIGGVQAVVLREKRPGAATADPITVKPTFSFDPSDPAAQEMRRRLTETLAFGGDVTIPGEFVDGFNVVTSSPQTKRLLGATDRDSPASVRITSHRDTTGLPMPVEISVRTPGGEVRHTAEVSLEYRFGGERGATLVGHDKSGALELKIIIEQVDDRLHGLRIDFHYEPLVGRAPHAVLPALELFTALEPGDCVALHAGPVPLGRTGPIDVDAISTSARHDLVDYIRALVTLQRYAGRLLPVPDDPDGEDADIVVNAAGLVEGRRVRLHANELRVEVRGDRADKFLEAMPQDEGALYATQAISVVIGEATVELGEVATYAPRMRLTNRREIVDAARNREDADAIFRCIDGEGIYWQRPVAGGPNRDG